MYLAGDNFFADAALAEDERERFRSGGFLNQPANLSDGQKYRFRLAAALASGKRFIFADEFCTSLDHITAAVIAYNIQLYAKRNKVTFILASSHEDILLDLAPDVLVVKELSGPAEVIYKSRADALI